MPGQPYPPSLIPHPDGPGPRIFGLGTKRSGPFRVGNRVWVQSLTESGWGRLLDISNQWERGLGTKTYPAFLVEFENDGRRKWFNGTSLRRR